MELSLEYRDAKSLIKLSRAGVQLLLDRLIEQLAAQFGYAVALDRAVLAAIAADFSLSLDEAGVCEPAELCPDEAKIVRYAPNDTGLIAAVSVVLSIDAQPKVEVEFVVAGRGEQAFMSLEQISSCAAA